MSKPNSFFVVILGALAALGPLCTDFYLPSLPDITQELQTHSSLIQLTITAALFGLGFGQLFWGPLSDKIGRKKPVLLSLLLFVVASFCCAFTHNVYQLILARFIQGVAGAGGAVLCRAIARDHFTGSNLTRLFVVIMTINGIAPIAAPVLGGFQLNFTSWNGLFITLSCIGLLLLIMTFSTLRESHTPNAGEQTSVIKAIAELMTHRQFLGMNLSQSFIIAGMFGYIGASSYVFQSHYGLSPQTYSYVFATNGVGMAVSSYIFAKFAKHWSEQSVIRYGLLLAVLSAFVLLISGLFAVALPVILGELFITIAFTSGLATLINSQAMQLSERNSGAASACLGTLMFAMGGLTAPLSSLGGTSLVSMALLITLCYLCSLISWFLLGGKTSTTTKSSTNERAPHE